uniref:Phd finger transcription factor n=2 Tax=Tetraselmis sp. GSL018 TaxID=582737 RepID=A0A061R839_9CHLO|mmetsp:Transcript_32422/g.76956  ORF Transcript_32422/g.76956 Transcript_32422/m.76956 type:complete len:1164 (-) Transcript_32422:198-3689(-)
MAGIVEKGSGRSQPQDAFSRRKHKTIPLSVLLDKGLLRDGEVLRYKTKGGQCLLAGVARREGIVALDGDSGPVGYTTFEAMAGSKAHRPSQHIHLPDGRTLAEVMELIEPDEMGGDEEPVPTALLASCPGTSSITVEPAEFVPDRCRVRYLSDHNDDSCWICGLEGDMVCCDTCPAIFHSEPCLDGEHVTQDGGFSCPACRCASCGLPCRGAFGAEWAAEAVPVAAALAGQGPEELAQPLMAACDPADELCAALRPVGPPGPTPPSSGAQRWLSASEQEELEPAALYLLMMAGHLPADSADKPRASAGRSGGRSGPSGPRGARPEAAAAAPAGTCSSGDAMRLRGGGVSSPPQELGEVGETDRPPSPARASRELAALFGDKIPVRSRPKQPPAVGRAGSAEKALADRPPLVAPGSGGQQGKAEGQKASRELAALFGDSVRVPKVKPPPAPAPPESPAAEPAAPQGTSEDRRHDTLKARRGERELALLLGAPDAGLARRAGKGPQQQEGAKQPAGPAPEQAKDPPPSLVLKGSRELASLLEPGPRSHKKKGSRPGSLSNSGSGTMQMADSRAGSSVGTLDAGSSPSSVGGLTPEPSAVPPTPQGGLVRYPPKIQRHAEKAAHGSTSSTAAGPEPVAAPPQKCEGVQLGPPEEEEEEGGGALSRGAEGSGEEGVGPAEEAPTTAGGVRPKPEPGPPPGPVPKAETGSPSPSPAAGSDATPKSASGAAPRRNELAALLEGCEGAGTMSSDRRRQRPPVKDESPEAAPTALTGGAAALRAKRKLAPAAELGRSTAAPRKGAWGRAPPAKDAARPGEREGAAEAPAQRPPAQDSAWADRAAEPELRCMQCHRVWHRACLSGSQRGSSHLPGWVCSAGCLDLRRGLNAFAARGAVPLMGAKGLPADVGPLRWQVARGSTASLPLAWREPPCKPQAASHPFPGSLSPTAVLAGAFALLEGTFGPIQDFRTGEDLLPLMVSGYSSLCRRLDFGGMMCAVVWADEGPDAIPVSAALFRALSSDVAEIVLVATAPQWRGHRIATNLVTAIENMCRVLGVERVVTPGLATLPRPTAHVWDLDACFGKRIGYEIGDAGTCRSLARYRLLRFSGTPLLVTEVQKHPWSKEAKRDAAFVAHLKRVWAREQDREPPPGAKKARKASRHPGMGSPPPSR